MQKWFKEKLKPKAVVFVDYEHWYYSYLSKWGFKPNVSAWRKEIESKYRIDYMEVFADFSKPSMSEEKAYLETIADRVYDTKDSHTYRNKDTTDFIMLDHIYRSAVKYRNIPNYVLFTGEGNFRSVVKFLTEHRKKVISYGVNGAYSGMLRAAATETILLPNEDEIYIHYRDFIIDNLAYCVDTGKIISTFSGTVEAVAKKHHLEGYPVKQVLTRMIDEGYLYQRDHYYGINKKTRKLAADWERLIAEGLFVVHEAKAAAPNGEG